MNRFTIKGKVKIIENDGKKIVIKEKKKDLKDLFEYLSSRGYEYFPNITNERNNSLEYEYLEKENTFNDNIDEDMINMVSLLHYKTAYYKNVSQSKFKEIYNKLIDNIDYLKDKYSKKIELIDNEEYMSPSSYLFARNYTIIMSNLYYIEKELNKWYKLVKDKTKERVCVVHNNLKKDNFFRGKKNILTGWDNYLVDTPVLDIYKLYRSEYNNVDMEYLLKVYNENNKLNEEEIILFNILISMPLNTNEELNEYDKVKEIKSCLFYIYKTSNFIKSNVFN